MPSWTSDQVLALAPDAASAQAGRGVATTAKWANSGCDEAFVWGEAKGSGANPYQTAIDLAEPAFKCTCPSRKFPCKHALGLFLLFTQNAVSEGTRPGWVDEWAQKRSGRAEKDSKPREAVDPVAQEKRAAKRDDRIAEGLADCAMWLRDLVRQGLSHASLTQPKHWEAFAARMADAQAPGLRRRLLEMGRLVNSGPGWPELVLARAAEIHLAIEAHSRMDILPDEVRADVRAFIGIPVRKEELMSWAPVNDFWLVAAQRTWEEEKISVQRTWLYGFGTGKWAMVLSFSTAGTGFDPPLSTGTAFHADMAYYPSAYPLRAMPMERIDAPSALPPEGTVGHMLDAFADALARNPWIDAYPVALHSSTLTFGPSGWFVVDVEGTALPIDDATPVWDLLAISGGRPASFLGEWDGRRFRPLTVMSDRRYRRV
jgi:hypothetical protein